MKKRKNGMKIAIVVLLMAWAVLPGSALAKTQIFWWHAMTGVNQERVEELAAKFNASQNDYEVKAVQKGSYDQALAAGIAAYRAKTHPQILQVFEVGTQTMLSSGAIYPVYELMKDQGIKIDWNDFLSVVKSYYSKDGNLYSMPFNSSAAILYYNKTTFKKAGLDPSKPPATFSDIERCAKAAVTSGATKIGFTVSWPSWTLMENMHAWHDQPFADNENGYKAMATQLKINGKLGIEIMDLLARWQKEGIFTYSGRGSKGDPATTSGDAAISLASTGIAGTLAKTAKFEWSTGYLPRLAGYPQGNVVIGGASLWVMKGHKPDENKGTARFLEFLGKVEQQAWWHAQTGYLPISNAALKSLQQTDHFKKNPNMWTAFGQISSGKSTVNSQGIRLGNFASVRETIEGEMENILSGKKTSKQGLDDAVKKGNEVLKEFASLYK